MAPDEKHSITALWLAMTAEAVRNTRPAEAWAIRIPCGCGGSLVVEFTGDPEEDDARLIEAFTRDHPDGLHEDVPVPSHVDLEAVERAASRHLGKSLRVIRVIQGGKGG